MVAGQDPPDDARCFAHRGQRLTQDRGRGGCRIEGIAGQQHMRSPMIARSLGQFGDGSVPRLHQTPANVTVRRLRNIREFAPDVQIRSVDEAECHAVVLNGLGRRFANGRQMAKDLRMRDTEGPMLAPVSFIAN